MAVGAPHEANDPVDACEQDALEADERLTDVGTAPRADFNLRKLCPQGQVPWRSSRGLNDCTGSSPLLAILTRMRPDSPFPDTPRSLPRGRGVFCNRTLNFRALKAVGYDMDYTLVDYRAEVLERRVFEMALDSFLSEGWPVRDLVFDPEMVARGLVIDTELGNLVKANRFGFVKRAMHGTQALDFSAQREAYTHALVDLAESRWVFLNTLFSLSEGCLYAQLVELLDQGKLPRVKGYGDLYRRVRAKVDAQHVEGALKAEIAAEPERFVVLDPEAALALLDQRAAGKKLVLITNSEWGFTRRMMAYPRCQLQFGSCMSKALRSS